MKFLVPFGGVVDHRFGVLTSPGHKGIPAGIVGGMDWAADNECFAGGFDLERFVDWLELMSPYRATCLFVTVPDVLGDAMATLERFNSVAWRLDHWPLAFVAQDGQECLDFPAVPDLSEWRDEYGTDSPGADVGRWMRECTLFSTVFIGGSTRWKLGEGALDVIERAQGLGKHVHIGRVNWWRRYSYFAGLAGGKDFTCDGTRNRFDGVARTVAAWARYMERPCQAHLRVSRGGDSGESDGCGVGSSDGGD